MRNVWIIGTGKDDGNQRTLIWEDFSTNNRVGIGFRIRYPLFELSERGEKTFVNQINSEKDNPGGSKTGKQCWQFVTQIQIDDWVIARRGQDEILGLGTIDSNYIFGSNQNDLCHMRNVNWEWKYDDRGKSETIKTENKMKTHSVLLLTKNSNSYNFLVDLIDQKRTRNFPNEVLDVVDDRHVEGALKTVWVNRHERNRKARDECVKHYMSANSWNRVRCFVCDFDFEESYGEIGKGFIHVHHKKPLKTIDEKYEVDPKEDLVPVCPNCHAMLHSSSSTLEIEELKQISIKAKQKVVAI